MMTPLKASWPWGVFVNASVLAVGLLISATSAAAQEAQFLNVGIYSADDNGTTEVDEDGVGHQLVKNERLALSTNTVPLKSGAMFGFQFKTTGVPEGAEIRVELHYPAPGAMPPGAEKPLLVSTDSVKASKGAYFESYSLSEPWEMLPGKWAFELWYGRKKLGEQDFTLVKD